MFNFDKFDFYNWVSEKESNKFKVKSKCRNLTNVKTENLKGLYRTLNNYDLCDVDIHVVKKNLEINFETRESLVDLIEHLLEVINEIGEGFDIVRGIEPDTSKEETRVDRIEI